MKLFKKKKEQYYNITATKETKHFDLKFTLQKGGTWETTLATPGDLKKFLDQLKDEDISILTCQTDIKHQFFLFKDKIMYGRCRPEKITISEWFTDAGDAQGFVETLKLDKWKEITIPEELKQ